jgi:hypothetical protein
VPVDRCTCGGRDFIPDAARAKKYKLALNRRTVVDMRTGYRRHFLTTKEALRWMERHG